MIQKVDRNIVALKKIASGGMAEIFIGKQIEAGKFQRYVAIKRVYPHFADKPNFKAMFLREVELSARLQHPNIVQVIKSIDNEGELLLIMEYIRGSNAAYLVNKFSKNVEKIPTEVCCYIMLETLKALSYAHSLKDESSNENLHIVHRDVSPGNIFIDYNGSVKLGDFGIAKSINFTNITKVGSMKGKFGYMAPELVKGAQHDARSDLFALGVVFYELLSASHLFDITNVSQLLESIAKFKPTDLHPHLQALSPDLIAILNKFLDPDPNIRFQTAAQATKELRTYMSLSHPDFSVDDFKSFLEEHLGDEISSKDRELSQLSATTSAQLAEIALLEAEEKTAIEKAVVRSKYIRFVIAVLIVVNTVFVYLALQKRARSKQVENVSSFVEELKPNAIPGLLAWFDVNSSIRAKNGSVDLWRSAGGLDLSVKQKTPAFQPKITGEEGAGRYLIFDGKNDFLTTEAIPAQLSELQELTVVLVAVPNPRISRSYLFSFHQKIRSLDVLRMGIKQSRIEIKYDPTYLQNYIRSKEFSFAIPSIYILTIGSDGLEFKVNGRIMINEALRAPYSFEKVGSFSLGQEWDDRSPQDKNNGEVKPSDFFKGQIGDVLIYKRVLSELEQEQVARYMSKKFQIS